MALIVSVDASSGVPVYLQIIEQVKRAMAIGVLSSGEQLPTAKQLARELSINPNTVLRAYRQLEQEHVISMSQGRGTFAGEGDPVASADATRSIAHEVAESIVERALRELTTLTLPHAELRRIVRDASGRILGDTRDA
jgi:GntR family transcriptional regulator